jgi:hypothetical protein
MNIMPCRYQELAYALAGYAKTGLQLVGFNGKQIIPSGLSDDIGLYYFVPKLVRLFHITLDQAIGLFFYTIVTVSCLFSLIGFFVLNTSWLFRGWAAISLVAFCAFSCRGMTDVYLVSSSLAIAIVPWALYFMRTTGHQKLFVMFLFLCGIATGYAHYIRAFSGIVTFVFMILSLVLSTVRSWKNKVILCAVLFAGVAFPIVNFELLIKQRKNYFGPRMDHFENRHVFWHTVYAGFGFLNNDLGIKWDDATIIEKIKKVSPNVAYPTREYESAVKNEVFYLFKNRSHFVISTIFAKLGVIFYYFLLFANLGLLVAFFCRKSWRVELLFLSALCLSSLFGIIALPGSYYLSGFVAYAFLYGLVSIECAVTFYFQGK